MENLKIQLKQRMLSAGFTSVGFTSAATLNADAENLKAMIAQNFHGEMDWLKTSMHIRPDPAYYFPEARTVMVATHNYYREETFFPEIDQGLISIYARGRDYHKVIRKKLKTILNWLKKEFPDIDGRIFVDSFPIMEKPLAVRAGLGWIGKNTTLISKNNGSYHFLGGIILNKEISPDTPLAEEFCGTCTRCQDSCPTNALLENGKMDARKCISYLTIEHEGEIPAELSQHFGNYIFGCDICQYVCPWNRKSVPTSDADFFSRFNGSDLLLSHLACLKQTDFEKMFAGTAVLRTGFKKFQRNVKIAQENLYRLRREGISGDTHFSDDRAD